MYSDGILFALICDNKLFVKPTEGGRKFIKDVVEAPAFKGAKLSFLIGDKIEDREWISTLVRITREELPVPKPKKSPKNEKLLQGAAGDAPCTPSAQVGQIVAYYLSAVYIASSRYNARHLESLGFQEFCEICPGSVLGFTIGDHHGGPPPRQEGWGSERGIRNLDESQVRSRVSGRSAAKESVKERRNWT